MIISQRCVDDADKVYLVAAMVKANELEARLTEGGIVRVEIASTGAFYLAATTALSMVAQMHREAEDDWDGVVWYELLGDADLGSLADLLVEDVLWGTATFAGIRKTVIKWLRKANL